MILVTPDYTTAVCRILLSKSSKLNNMTIGQSPIVEFTSKI